MYIKIFISIFIYGLIYNYLFTNRPYDAQASIQHPLHREMCANLSADRPHDNDSYLSGRERDSPFASVDCCLELLRVSHIRQPPPTPSHTTCHWCQYHHPSRPIRTLHIHEPNTCIVHCLAKCRVMDKYIIILSNNSLML